MSKEEQSANQRDLLDYCQRFRELNVNRSGRGEALYQPILLLSIIDLIVQGAIKDKYVFITKELQHTFNSYKDILISKNNINKNNQQNRNQGSLSLPFFHLQNEERQFWYLDYKPKYYQIIQTTKKTINNKIRKSITQLENYVNYACIAQELFCLIPNENSRKELVETLVNRWFSASENSIDNLLQANQSFQTSIQKEINQLNQSNRSGNEPKFYYRKAAARDYIFGKAVVGLYDYKCAFCGLKVNDSLGQNIVGGAHIEPFSISFNNKISNGVSLCKNHHWAFDKGWFSISDDYKIIVSNDLWEEAPNAKRKMQDFNGETILLPDAKKYDPEQYYPSHESLQWHRKKWRFQA